MKNMRKIIPILTLIFGLNELLAQDIFITRHTICDTCSKDFNFRLESSSFFKNNEYESDFATSLTGIGILLKPTIEYYFNKNTRLNLGSFGLKYSGLNSFSQIVPIYQIQHRITNGTELVFGSIYGNINHNLAEPLYRFDRYYFNNVEYGIQMLHKSQYFDSDLWLNWEQFILEGDPFQEEFTIGTHSKLNIINKKNIELKGDVQFLVNHKGGEIDSYSGSSFYVFNGAFGWDFSFKTKRLSYTIRPKYLYYKNTGLPDNRDVFKYYNEGNGVLFSGDIEHKYFYFESGYWNGNKFISPSGEYLYMSISNIANNLYKKQGV